MTAADASPRRIRSTRSVNGILRPSRRPVAVLIVAVAAIIAITAGGFALKAHAIDLGLSETLNRMHTGFIGEVTTLVYHVFSPTPAIIITVVVTGMIWVASRQLSVAAAFAGVVAVTWIPSVLVKELVHRSRPDAHLMAHPYTPVQVDPSYPSGHIVFITVFVIALVFVLRGTGWTSVGVIGGTALILIVAFSLMVDAVHYPTDVLASVVWSVTVAPAVRYLWAAWLMPKIPYLRPRSRR